MFVGICVSEHEISVSVVVKHVKHIGTVGLFCLPGGGLVRFFIIWGGHKNCHPPISYTRSSPQKGDSAPPTTKMLIGNPALRAIAEFINKMIINLCNRTFTQ